jgi:hypothetical protein
MAPTYNQSSDTHSHLLRSNKRHSGIHTVTPTPRAASVTPSLKRDVPFGELVFGPEAGHPPTAYKPILRF